MALTPNRPYQPCQRSIPDQPRHHSGTGFVRRYFERLSEAFLSALRNAQERGELRPAVVPRTEASFFTASVLGIFVMLRAQAAPAVIEDAAHVAIGHLESLRVASSTEK